MRLKPILPIYRSSEKDERHAAEEKRVKVLLDLLCEMNVPHSKVQFLKLRSQRYDTLKWLSVNLAINNSHHKSFKRVDNLVKLLLKTSGAS